MGSNSEGGAGDGMKIVISGISGRFPESNNMKEFMDNLLANKNMVTSNDRRFKSGLFDIPKGFGTLKEIDKFDAEVFGILPKQAENIDPQSRIALETTYEALADAGINPNDVRGRKTGVFTAVMFHEALEVHSAQPARITGHNSVQLFGSLIPNRISYTLDWIGPSINYDTACSSSFIALEAAVQAIRLGKCQDAVVVGSNIILTPTKSLMFNQAVMLANDSRCRAFDSKGNGYARAEAVVTIFIQRKSVAKRSYFEILGIGSNTDGYKEQGAYSPSAFMQEELLDEVYADAKVDPMDVTYFEAHGTGTPAGDPPEIKAISRFFCLNNNRKTPLLVGSVKSNMGHAECASGLCSIAKLVAVVQSGIIPTNLHFENPHFQMKYIRDGKIEIVTRNTKWEGGLIGVNSFGFGGVNAHVILKPTIASPHKGSTSQDIVLFAGKTNSGIQRAIEEILESSDPNLLYLVNELNKSPLKSEKARGFGISNLPGDEEPCVEIRKLDKPITSIWYVFNGMGSHWVGMGRSLLETVSTFKQAFQQCCQALKAFDYDLEHVFSSNDQITFMNNPTNSFVCIGAVQIGLFYILDELGLKADGFIGHSCGEHLCAFADGCLTLEETIISIFLRGQACNSLETKGIEYGMAAVNMGWENLQKICPQELYVVCHNGPESSTIAGPLQLILKFKTELENVSGDYNVKEVQSSGMPFHSPYMSECTQTYQDFLKSKMKILPKARSTRWISTSIPKCKMTLEESKLFTLNYLVQNFSCPVMFLEALQKIPSGSTIVEIGPSGLLRGLIQRGTKDSSVVSLQIRNETNCLLALQKGLGRLFLAGLNFDVNQIASYRNKIKTPVPGSTPMVGHLVDWDHSVSWNVPSYQKAMGSSGIGHVTVDLSNPADSYLEGHALQGRVLYPTTGYIHMVWKLFAQINFTSMYELPIVFENLKILRVTLLRQNEIIEFNINISEVSGYFEVKEGDAVVCCGKIRTARVNEEKVLDQDFEAHGQLNPFMNTYLQQNEIYKKLRHLGYEYHGLFKGILNSNLEGTDFKIEWNDNWVGFLDTFLQTSLRIYSESDLLQDLAVPTEIIKVLINPIIFRKCLKSTVHVQYNPFTTLIKCMGIEVEGMKTANLSKNIKTEQVPIISNYAFEPYFYENTGMVLTHEDYSPLLRCISIVVDNMSFVHDKTIYRIPNILEVSNLVATNETLDINNAIRIHFAVPEINYVFCTSDLSNAMDQTFTKENIKTRTTQSLVTNYDWLSTKWDLIIVDDAIWYNIKTLSCLSSGGFFILKLLIGHKLKNQIKNQLPEGYQLIAHKISESSEVFLIRKNTRQKSNEIHFINAEVDNFEWINKARELVVKQEELGLKYAKSTELPRLFFISNGIPLSGILGFMHCFRKEPYSSQARCIFSPKTLKLEFDNPNMDHLLKEILDKDLIFNVFDEDGNHGCYIHSQLKKIGKVTNSNSSFVGIETPGDLTTFKWFQGFEFSKLINTLPKNYIPVQVHVSGLNFKDVMIASGNLYPEYYKKFPIWNESPIGLEFSGIVVSDSGSKTKRVCGFASAQCLSSQVLVENEYLIDVPEKWTLQEAATVPVVYATAYFALVIRGNIQKNSSILIHSGAGGVGIAAIRIALSYNCNVFTTVGSDNKIEFIKKMFPEIPDSNIGYSRDVRFENMVRNGTQGKGVNLILNSLSGDKLEASLRCLAHHGQFLEIGRVDLSKNSLIGLNVFLNDVSINGIFLVSLCDGSNESKSVWKRLKNLMMDGIESGVVKPLPYREFTIEQIEPAFRFMGQGVHIGKVIINIQNEQNCALRQIPSKPQIYFNPEKVYIIIGGLGGVGQELINWMTRRYARKILITSRNGDENLRGYTQSYLKIWRERGIEVRIIKFQPQDDVQQIFSNALEMGKTVGGIFNLAMHLDPKLVKIQTVETFQKTIIPKTHLTMKLDVYSRAHCPELDFFVVFSSISAGLGYDGMTGYGFGNSSVERIIEVRQKDGFPGTGIQFGPIGDVGAWHENYNADFSRTSFHGSAIQSIRSVLKSLDYLLSPDIPSTSPITLCRRTIQPNSRGDGSQLLETSLLDRLAQILGHSDGSKINVKCTLAELGMESVMSIEAKNVLENEFGLTLSATGLREFTLEQLNEMAANTQNERTVVRAQVPNPKLATAPLVQLNFFKSMNRSFNHDEILYPLNVLAKNYESGPGPKVIICNSFEAPDVLRPLASYIKAPTFCLQVPTSLEHYKHWTELAKTFYEKLEDVVPEGPYLFAGLSIGIYPAYELCAMLQHKNQIISCIFMDMTFERFKAIVEENGGNFMDFENFNQELLVTSSCQIFGFDVAEVENLLRGETTAEKKTDRLMELVSKATGAEPNNLKFGMDWGSTMRLFRGYEQCQKYHGKVGLIKTTQNVIAYDSTCEFWGLEKICTQTPEVLTVDTTHSYMIAEPAVQEVAQFFNNSISNQNV